MSQSRQASQMRKLLQSGSLDTRAVRGYLLAMFGGEKGYAKALYRMWQEAESDQVKCRTMELIQEVMIPKQSELEDGLDQATDEELLDVVGRASRQTQEADDGNSRATEPAVD